MIDHITFGTADRSRSCRFYDQALAPLGLRRLVSFRDRGDVAGYGDERPWLWIAEEHATRGKLYIPLVADRRALVDACHAAALGGRAGQRSPGLRPWYDPDYYAAFVIDPDGHNIKAVCRRAE